MSKNSLESVDEKRPADARTDILPTEGHSLEVDGKLKAQFPEHESALEAGTALKKQFPSVQIRIYNAKARTRTPVD
jgi:hypothetical protein